MKDPRQPHGVLDRLAVRRGHFALESGLHTDRWFALDGLFVEPLALALGVDELAELLRPYDPSALCGPLLGGAFLAQALAMRMGIRFYFTERVANADGVPLFSANYRLPHDVLGRVATERIAVVDDVISAGSSARATIAALRAARAEVVAVGALVLLGEEAIAHFESLRLPLVAVERDALELWTPSECPLCRDGHALEAPS